MMFAINWRNRLLKIDNELAGNYEGGLIFDPQSYEEPQNIRKTLNKPVPMIREGETPLPGFCEQLRMRLSLITSWAFPFEFILPGKCSVI